MARRRFALSEDFDSEFSHAEPPAEPIADGPKKMEDLGVSQILSSLIQDEWQAIDAYKSAIATLTALGGHEAEIAVLEDVVSEEMAHVGQIEACASGSAPEVSEIESGKDEAESRMADAESPVDESLAKGGDGEKKGAIDISGPSAEKLYHAIADGDDDKVCRYALLVLGKAQSLVKDDEGIVNDIFGLMGEFADASGVDDANRCLRELYDFCDAYGINIDATEVPDDSEVIIKKPDYVDVKVSGD